MLSITTVVSPFYNASNMHSFLSNTYNHNAIFKIYSCFNSYKSSSYYQYYFFAILHLTYTHHLSVHHHENELSTNLHFPYLHEFFIGQTSAEKINNVLDFVTVLHLINVALSTCTQQQTSANHNTAQQIHITVHRCHAQ